MKLEDLDQIVRTPELDVVRVVSLREDKVLLVQEVDDENWKLPGGKIHSGETIFEAFQREIEEELGFRPDRESILNYDPANIPESENIRHILLVKPVDDGQIVKTEDVEQATYFSIDSLPETKFKGHILSAIEIITT